MAEELDWLVETIPDSSSVFMHAHRMYFSQGELEPGAFREQQGGMSVDWEKYSTAEETRMRAKKPDQNAVLKLPVLGIREIKSLSVVHEPDRPRNNRAHSEVFGIAENETEARVKLLRIAPVAIPVRDPL